jgi:hypothetical protein
MSDPIPDILPADRRLRRCVAFGLLALTVLAILVLELGAPWLVVKFQQDPREAVRALKLLMLAAFAPLIPVGVYIFSFGRRAVQAGHFPPPGARVIVDTRIVQGRAARLRGGVLMLIGLALTGITLFAALVVPALVERSFFAAA